MFNGALLISKYLLFIGYIQNALTVNFHTIFTIVRSSSAPVTNDHRGVTVHVTSTGLDPLEFLFLPSYISIFCASAFVVRRLCWRSTNRTRHLRVTPYISFLWATNQGKFSRETTGEFGMKRLCKRIHFLDFHPPGNRVIKFLSKVSRKVRGLPLIGTLRSRYLENASTTARLKN